MKPHRIERLSHEYKRNGTAPLLAALEVHSGRVLGKASVVLAWNADFDQRMLHQTAKRYGLELPIIEWYDLLGAYRSLGHQGNHLD